MPSEIPFIDIPLNNLYMTGYLLPQDDNAEDLLYRISLSIKPEWEDRWHIVQNEDELDDLAQYYYGPVANNAHALWWLIAEANGISNPLDISYLIGINILIPEYFRIKKMIQDIQSNDGLDDDRVFNAVPANPYPPIVVPPGVTVIDVIIDGDDVTPTDGDDWAPINYN